MVVDAAPQEAGSGYPVRFDVEYPESLSKLLIFVKFIFVIPVMIVLYLVQSVVSLAWAAGWR